MPKFKETVISIDHKILLTFRKNNQTLFSAQTSHTVERGQLNFIQIFTQDNTFVVKTNGQLDQIAKIPAPVTQSFLTDPIPKSDLKIKFEKKSDFEIFDFCLNCSGETDFWTQLVSGYYGLVTQNQNFLEDEKFMFFSHFAKEFRAKGGAGKDMDSVSLFVESVVSDPQPADTTTGTKYIFF